MRSFKLPLAYQFVSPTPTGPGNIPGKRKVEDAAMQNVQAMIASGIDMTEDDIDKAVNIAVSTMRQLEKRFGSFEDLNDWDREENETYV